MRIGVVGGGLQGVEAAYLARKAGWEVRLVDRKPHPPALGLCDDFVQCDAADTARLKGVLGDVDLVLPALEDDAALVGLASWAQRSKVAFAFDPDAYSVASSKLASNRLFARLALPAPLPWPQCRPPLLAKPAVGSGSRGVHLIRDPAALAACFGGSKIPEGWIVEEFVEGPSHSLEVIGFNGRYQALQVTDLAMDQSFDCKRVRAPSILPPALRERFEWLSLEIARAISLNGIMDVEVIRDGPEIKVLEIDARLPSQTPLTVFWSSGLNMVEILGGLFCGHRGEMPLPPAGGNGAILEHVRFSHGVLAVCGEHVMAAAGPLRVVPDFFGADEAITNYTDGRSEWVASLIVHAADRVSAWTRRNDVIGRIFDGCKVCHYTDFEPMSPPRGRPLD